MIKQASSVTYTYSFFSLAGLIILVVYLSILGPFISIILQHGWASFYADFQIFIAAIYEQITEDALQFLNEYGLLLLIFLGMAYLCIERTLVVFFTRLTITEKSITYKNPFNNIEIPLQEVEGYQYHAKQRYVIYSKQSRKKKIYVDMMLHKSAELLSYMEKNFTKLS